MTLRPDTEKNKHLEHLFPSGSILPVRANLGMRPQFTRYRGGFIEKLRPVANSHLLSVRLS